jgi:hypothetical protein
MAEAIYDREPFAPQNQIGIKAADATNRAPPTRGYAYQWGLALMQIVIQKNRFYKRS